MKDSIYIKVKWYIFKVKWFNPLICMFYLISATWLVSRTKQWNNSCIIECNSIQYEQEFFSEYWDLYGSVNTKVLRNKTLKYNFLLLVKHLLNILRVTYVNKEKFKFRHYVYIDIKFKNMKCKHLISTLLDFSLQAIYVK